MSITIQALRPDLAPDFFHFFDHVAFTDNPRWASCYCHFYHSGCTVEEWYARTAEQNREATEQRIKTGTMNGFLAYADGTPAGWCHADDKNAFPAFRTDGDEKVGTIVCFIVAPAFRRQGIAKQLLAAACDGLKHRGFTAIEGTPAKNGRTDAENYHGPLDLYTASGFAILSEDDYAYTVRKPLI